jgi:hypothetical protein
VPKTAAKETPTPPIVLDGPTYRDATGRWRYFLAFTLAAKLSYDLPNAGCRLYDVLIWDGRQAFEIFVICVRLLSSIAMTAFAVLLWRAPRRAWFALLVWIPLLLAHYWFSISTSYGHPVGLVWTSSWEERIEQFRSIGLSPIELSRVIPLGVVFIALPLAVWLRRDAWTIVAAAWCFSSIDLEAAWSPIEWAWELLYDTSWFDRTWRAQLQRAVYCWPSVLTGILLLIRPSWARLPAAAATARYAGEAILGGYSFWAGTASYHFWFDDLWAGFSAPFFRGLSRELMTIVYLESLWACMTLILIGWYARNTDTRAMPKPTPGLPFPQSFCPRCRYNLHGQQTGRCSECGQVLLMSGG